ncbi:sucrase-isomaltase, intestinal-like [Eriocheir sinensis]|uniref:sucrase-isomaltase, intestinal-like n=1 Tax=Eriocheir sinensis TaxID=95602 RepID=UPI0021C9C1DB|nr:sucrase-isomaltase, intestinal-like [Eriocheir sinensis]
MMDKKKKKKKSCRHIRRCVTFSGHCQVRGAAMHERQTARTVLLLLLLGACTLASAQLNLLAIECPFPEGQAVLSEAECNKYTACEWTDGRCHSVDNAVGGYVVDGEPQDTGRGFTVALRKSDPTVTMFGQDLNDLIFEVIYHEDYHLQIKIYSATEARYEVPVPLSLPETATNDTGFLVGVAANGDPFHFNVTRASNGNSVFHSAGPLTFEDQFIQIHTWLASSYLYGFGESTHINFRHTFEPRSTYAIWARDQAVTTEPTNEYGHHPYYMVMEDDEGNSHSVLLYNSNAMEYSTFLLDDGTPTLTLRSIGGILDFHFFLGPTPEDTTAQYVSMIGYPAFPPYWALGFHLSRWGYNSSDQVRAVRERMKAMNIPQDVQVIDSDYMERQRDFTYDPVKWGDLPELMEELHNDNIKVTLIVDPALVIDFDNYEPASRGRDADVFVKWSDPSLVPADQEPGCNDYMIGYVWPDTKTIFPDFFKPETQDWWVDEIKLFHETIEFDALWIDMNEPANFGTDLEKPWNWPADLPPWSLKCGDDQYNDPVYPTRTVLSGVNQNKRITDHTLCMTASHTDGNNTWLHYNVHSLYGWSETVPTYRSLVELFPGRRPLVLSRSTFVGSGQYAVHWLGDNAAEWEHMKMSIVGLFDFNMFGMPMVGADICGFSGEPDMEMCARWMQLGAFYPFSRNHNAHDAADQDPTVWPEVAEISRYILNVRYKYLPYLYFYLHRASMHGGTVVRPLLYIFPDDLTARDVDDQFLWGDGLMVAPVITQGAVSRDVYFPQGVWYNLIEGSLAATGPTTLTVDAPLEVIPLYVRGGVILPFQEPSITTTDSILNPYGMTVALDETGYAFGRLFWDGGDSNVMETSYMCVMEFLDNTLTTSIMHGEESVVGLNFETISIYGASENPTAITVNNATLPDTDWNFDAAVEVLTFNLSAPLSEPLTVVIS